jgi:hypothetical protein
MSKLAGIYERKGKLFISAFHKTEAGFWVGADETAVVSIENINAISEAVTSVLADSKEGVPTPARDFDPTASLLLKAGVASWNTFAKSAKSVSVELDNGTFEIIPEKNKGSREGVVPMLDKAVKLYEGSGKLGEVVLAALEVAE